MDSQGGPLQATGGFTSQAGNSRGGIFTSLAGKSEGGEFTSLADKSEGGEFSSLAVNSEGSMFTSQAEVKQHCKRDEEGQESGQRGGWGNQANLASDSDQVSICEGGVVIVDCSVSEVMPDCEKSERGQESEQTGVGGDQVLSAMRVRNISGANVCKIVSMFKGKSENEDDGRLKVMSGRQEIKGRKSKSKSTPIKKKSVQKTPVLRKETPKKVVKKPSVRKQEEKKISTEKVVNVRTVRIFKTNDKDEIQEDNWKENFKKTVNPSTSLLKSDKKKAVKTPVNVLMNQQAKQSHAKGEGSQTAKVKLGRKKKDMLEETASKLKLRKIQTFFEQKTFGGNKNQKTSSSNEGVVGVTRAVTTGTVQRETELCVAQSEQLK